MLLNPSTNIFNTGEVTPYMHHRREFKKFPSSCERMENCLSLIYGPFIKRSGSKQQAIAKYNDKLAILVPFIFSETQAYILEFGHNYVRFYTNDGQLIKTLTTTDAWITSTSYTTSYSYVKESNIIYKCLIGHTSGVFATDLAAGKWEIQDIYEVPSPYGETQLADLTFEQNNDILFITFSGYRPMKLSRYGHTNWIMEEKTFRDGPYQAENANATYLLAPSATTGNITIQATGFGPFSTDSVGQHVWMKHSGTPDVIGWAIITAYNNAGNVDATVYKAFGGTGNTASWRLGHYTEGRGWPYTNVFHSGRHYFGGSNAAPGRIDGSTPDDYETFSPVDQETTEVTDASAISATIASGKSNIIKWLLSMTTLFTGTTGAEQVFEAEGGDTALTPTNYIIKEISQHGSKLFKPIKLNNTGLFIQKAGRKVREITYSFTEDKYVFPDLSVFAEHLTYGGIKQIAYQEEPHSIFWVVKEDGSLISFTYDKRQEVIAWSRHKLGGNFSKVLSVATIPHSEENRDRVWLLVERYINGSIVRYIEYFENEFNGETDQEDGFFVDSGYTHDIPLDIEAIYWSASPVLTVIKKTGHGLTTDDTIVIRDLEAYTEGANFADLNGQEFKINTVFDADFIGINIDSSSYATYNAQQGGTIRKFISEITSGLTHLEGETVDVVVDGVVNAVKTVTSGEITLDAAGATVHVGLKFTAYWKSLKLSRDLGDGSPSSAKKQKIHAIDIDVYRTNYLKYGTTVREQELFNELPISGTVELKTEKVTTDFGGEWGKEPQVIIKSDLPVPLCVLEVTPLLSVN